jgi:hypothetical protein
MKTLPAYIWLVVAVLLVVGLLWTTREGFVPEIDRSQEKRTRSREDSSHEQLTNHFDPSGVAFPAMLGSAGKDQINQWKGAVV